VLTERDRDVLKWIENYKAITLKQANTLFFNNYKSCSRRLKQLEEEEKILKSYQNSITKEKVYYVENKISAHDLFIYDFYAKLVQEGAKIRKFKKQPQYLSGLIRPDGFFEFEYEGNLYFILLEIDLTHFTSTSKFGLYEKLFKENEIQKECYNTFPIVTVIRPTNNDIRYNSNNFEVVYLDFKFTNFRQLIL